MGYSTRMGTVVEISSEARKQLSRVPTHVALKLNAWVSLVEKRGVEEARKIPGFHDEPLKGERAGERSIRLSRSYRAIYTISRNGEIRVIVVKEVTKHDY
jgi:toxin HigB-1